jgi:FkbM family methyltransferase
VSAKGRFTGPVIWHVYRGVFNLFGPMKPFLIFTEMQGFKIYISALDYWVGHVTLKQGFWESQTTALFRRELKEGMVVLDVGANIGYFSLLAATLVGATGKVFAFEPGKGYSALIQKSTDANGFKNVTVVKKAVLDRTGKIRLRLSPSAPFTKISAVCLDDYFADFTGSVDLIKIDVDGSEGTAIAGMMQLLKRNPSVKLIVEYDAKRVDDSPDSHWLDSLLDMGFEVKEKAHANLFLTR